MNDYQNNAIKTDKFYNDGTIRITDGFLEKAFGLCGEAGEVAEKIKKVIRDEGSKINAERRLEIAKELGDVFWYVSVMAYYLDFSLEEIAEMNIKKLSDRKKRNKISGSGDNR